MSCGAGCPASRRRFVFLLSVVVSFVFASTLFCPVHLHPKMSRSGVGPPPRCPPGGAMTKEQPTTAAAANQDAIKDLEANDDPKGGVSITECLITSYASPVPPVIKTDEVKPR